MDTATVLMLVTAVLIPLVSSLIAREHWPAELVGILSLAIAGLSGFVTEWASNVNGFDWRHGSVLALAAFGVAVGARYGLWKGTVTDAKILAFPVIESKPAAELPPAA